MNKITILLACLTACLFFSCGKKKAQDDLGDSGRTKRTERLLAHLSSTASRGFLFGQQDATLSAEGSMKADSVKIDVQDVCGDLPTLVGFEMGGIEKDDSANVFSVPFSDIRREIVAQFDKAGVVTISWQCAAPSGNGSPTSVMEGGERHDEFIGRIDKAAEFIASLVTPYGVSVPVIFRPWQDNGETKQWWNKCNKEQYLALWQMTVERFKEKGVTNVLFAYSPCATDEASEAKYLDRYPGDEAVDILGINAYCHAAEGDTVTLDAFTHRLDQNLRMLSEIGKKKGKPVALTETGYRGIKSDNWWTHTLLPAVEKYPVSYVMLWRTSRAEADDYYVPFPGQRSAEDFVTFYNAPKTLFLHDINGIYL